jgi:hypothetical protein
MVTILAVDLNRRRLSLSLKTDPFHKPGSKTLEPKKLARNSNPHRPIKPDGPFNNPFAALKNIT